MKHLPPIIAAIAIVLLLMGGYAGAYLGLARYSEHRLSIGLVGVRFPRPPDLIVRQYGHRWCGTVFSPAAWVESRLRGVEVELLCPGPRPAR